jgi:hypothetical protein
MSREIKFRGKKLNRDEWVYGDLNHYPISTRINEIRVNPETTGQYTSLKDKFGKEIYEGDILRAGGDLYRVYFKNGAFRVSNPPIKITDLYLEMFLEVSNNTEVIGNIFDNPKMLEPKDESAEITKA